VSDFTDPEFRANNSHEVSREEFLTALNRRSNKYSAVRTYSDVCQRWFASRLEARRGEYLWNLQLAGGIRDLQFQPRYTLSRDPRVQYVADFTYLVVDPGTGFDGPWVIEDTKGLITDASRVKLAWMAHNGRPVTIVKENDW